MSWLRAELYRAGCGRAAKAQRPAAPAKPDSPRQKQTELHEMEEKLLDILGTKVRITGNGKKGKIEIAYLSMDDLDRIYAILRGQGR